MEFSKRLQELRKQKGLTQEELASVLFVSRTAVSKWESGRGYPNIDSLKAIADFFGITVDALLSGNELLSIAQADGKQKESRLRSRAFGLLDLGVLLLLFLPLFGQEVNGALQTVPLLSLVNAPQYLLVAYFLAIGSAFAIGVVSLTAQSNSSPSWIRGTIALSLCLNTAGTILFILCRQPYAAMLSFIFLTIKAFLLIKRQ